jgi:hypothetical protein
MSDEQTNEQDESEGIKNLRAKAEKAEAAEARVARLERELAFTQAGISTSSKPAQALLASYDGELTPEAIKAEAAEWGLIAGESNDPEPETFTQDSPEVQFQQQRESIDQGGKVADPTDVPKRPIHEQAMENFQTNRQKGMSQEEARATAFGEVIKAAAMGDKGARFDEAAWEAERAKYGHGAEYA